MTRAHKSTPKAPAKQPPARKPARKRTPTSDSAELDAVRPEMPAMPFKRPKKKQAMTTEAFMRECEERGVPADATARGLWK